MPLIRERSKSTVRVITIEVNAEKPIWVAVREEDLNPGETVHSFGDALSSRLPFRTSVPSSLLKDAS